MGKNEDAELPCKDHLDGRDLVSLRDHMEALCNTRTRQYFAAIGNCEDKIEALERAVGEKFQWLDRSTSQTAAVMDKRLEGMNEFRDSLRDLTARLATREEVENVKVQIGKMFSRTEHDAFMKVVDADFRVLREFKAELQGKASQTHVIISFLMGAVGAIAGLAAVIRQLMQ